MEWQSNRMHLYFLANFFVILVFYLFLIVETYKWLIDMYSHWAFGYAMSCCDYPLVIQEHTPTIVFPKANLKVVQLHRYSPWPGIRNSLLSTDDIFTCYGEGTDTTSWKINADFYRKLNKGQVELLCGIATYNSTLSREDISMKWQAEMTLKKAPPHCLSS